MNTRCSRRIAFTIGLLVAASGMALAAPPASIEGTWTGTLFHVKSVGAVTGTTSLTGKLENVTITFVQHGASFTATGSSCDTPGCVPSGAPEFSLTGFFVKNDFFVFEASVPGVPPPPNPPCPTETATGSGTLSGDTFTFTASGKEAECSQEIVTGTFTRSP